MRKFIFTWALWSYLTNITTPHRYMRFVLDRRIVGMLITMENSWLCIHRHAKWVSKDDGNNYISIDISNGQIVNPWLKLRVFSQRGYKSSWTFTFLTVLLLLLVLWIYIFLYANVSMNICRKEFSFIIVISDILGNNNYDNYLIMTKL